MTEPQAPTCRRCARPMRHDTALICSQCASMLRRHLEDVAKIAGDITITVARLDRVTRSGGGSDDLGWWKGDDGFDPNRRPATNLAVRGTTDRSALAPLSTPGSYPGGELHRYASHDWRC